MTLFFLSILKYVALHLISISDTITKDTQGTTLKLRQKKNLNVFATCYQHV